jgi:hypothetical protein
MMTDLGRDASPGCPDAEILAAWSDQGLHEDERSRVDAHVADCARCQMHLAAMARMPQESLAPAREPRFRLWQWLVPATAGAAAVAAWMLVQQPNLPPPAATSIADAALEQGEPAQPITIPGGVAESAPKAVEQSVPPSASVAELDELRRQQAQSLRSKAREIESAQERAATIARIPADSAGQAAGTRATARPDAPPVAGEVPATAATVPAPAPAPPPPAAAPATSAFEARREQYSVADLSSSLNELKVQRALDGRVTWTVEAGLASQLLAGSSPSPSVIWLSGRSGLVLLSLDGRVWRRLPFPEVVDLTGITAKSEFAATVTTADGRTFTTADRGLTWARQ